MAHFGRNLIRNFAAAAAVAALAAGGAYAAGTGDHSHGHDDRDEMLENMKRLHEGHDHEHDFERLDDVTEDDMHHTIDMMVDLGLALPPMDSARGRSLFVEKGCIVCHAVNGVGGEIGPSLNAADMPAPMNAFEFAARMWRGAEAMVQMQRDLFGTAIDLDGAQLADIVAFVHDETEQRKVAASDIPETYRKLIE